MKIRKAVNRVAANYRDDPAVTIVLRDGSSVRGIIVDFEATTEPFGAPGEQVAGLMSATMRIEVTP